MIGTKEKKSPQEEAEEVKAILETVSKEVPALLKSIIASVFSEEAGRNMGKAAAAFYKELKESGMPDSIAVKMTEDYISVFTSLGDVLKGVGSKKRKEREIEEEVSKKVKQKLAEKGLLEESREEEEGEKEE